VAWHDYAPQLGAPGSGVIFAASPAGATVTWLNVPNSGAAPGTSTFQVQFKPNGTVHMLWQNLSTNGNGYLIGWSRGGGASDPGNTDLTTALPVGIQVCGTAPQLIELSIDARPILGTTIQQTTSNIASSTPFGVLVTSLDQAIPAIDLASFGMEGCFAHTSSGVNQLWFPAGASTVSIPLAIPSHPSFMGVSLVTQSYSYLPPLTSLGMIASNGILLFLGPL